MGDAPIELPVWPKRDNNGASSGWADGAPGGGAVSCDCIRAVSMLARDPLGQAARYSTARVIVQRLRTLRIAQMLVTRYLHLLTVLVENAESLLQLLLGVGVLHLAGHQSAGIG